jgi:hypothetical protein
MVNLGPGGFSQNPMPQNFRQQPASTGVPMAQPTVGSNSALLQPGSTQLPTQMIQAAPLAMANLLATTLTPQETAMFLKNLLRLPPDIQAVLMLLAFPPGQERPENLQRLLAQFPDTPLKLETLQAFLSNQTQEGMQKLFKLLQSTMGQGDPSAQKSTQKSMEELVRLTSQLGGKINMSPPEALNTLMLLYLPWLPLVPPQRLETAFQPSEGEGEGDSGDSGGGAFNLVLFIDTNVLGTFKVSVGLENTTQLSFHVTHAPVAARHLPSLESSLTAHLAEDGIPSPVFAYESQAATPHKASLPTAASTAEEAESPADGKKIAVYPTSGVSVLSVAASYQYARLIFETDDRLHLQGARKKKLES